MINPKQLYSDLMTLCEAPESPFYFVDQIHKGNTYRIFNYRLAQYSDWLKPGALDCRGTMYKVYTHAEAELVCLPMSKFFNLSENPMTMNLDFSQGAELIMDKMDGSLISSYLSHPFVFLKSKGSLVSEQAVAAYKWLTSNSKMLKFVQDMTFNKYTVNMEWTAPDNQVVLSYQEPRLTVLNLRGNLTGNYMPYSALKEIMGHWDCSEYIVANHAETITDLEAFINSIPAMQDKIEGYVIKLRDGTFFKCKTEKYSLLHRLRDGINHPRNMYELVVNEGHDDLRAAFPDDTYLLGKIDEMVERVKALYMDIKHNVNDFYEANKELDRKRYAILAQSTVKKPFFGLAMNLYVGKSYSEKEFLIKNYKEFGIKDVDIVEE